MLPPLSKAPLFRPDVCPPGSLPADTRGEASYLSRRLVSKASRLELDPALSWRGVGRTSMIPYVPYIPPERIHLAASGRYNPILDLTESLTSALDANAPASPPASPPRSASPQSAAASPQAAAAAGTAEGEAPAADASSPAEAPAPDALPPLVPQLLHSDIEREIERKAQVSAPPPPPAAHLPHEHAHRLPSSPSRCLPLAARWLDASHVRRAVGKTLRCKRAHLTLSSLSPLASSPLILLACSQVRVLLSLGADPNARDRHGNVPLHKAAVAGAAEKVRRPRLTVAPALDVSSDAFPAMCVRSSCWWSMVLVSTLTTVMAARPFTRPHTSE